MRKRDYIASTVLERERSKNTPYVNPVDCLALLTPEEIEANADNAEVIHRPGVNHLVIEVFADHWHVAQVGGYTPDGGMYIEICQ